MRPDDCTLSPYELRNVRDYAGRLLREAEAIGRYPTPIGDLVAAARLEINREASLDASFLKRLCATVTAPIKRAIEKVLGLLDRRERLIYLDQSVHKSKQVFLSVHETGHEFLPWQRETFAILEDCQAYLEPDVHDQFEREANVFASEVLFQLDGFSDEAAAYDLGLQVPLRLAKRYGASCYASVRRYVSTNHRACSVLVLERPVYEVGTGYTVSLRRILQSPSFTKRFGQIPWKETYGPQDFLTSVLPIDRRFTAPRHFRLQNANQEDVSCVLEAFDSTYQIFVLIYPESELRRVAV